MPTGIYEAIKKDGTKYYRASITYRNKHISLGSSDDYETALLCYQTATEILRNKKYKLNDYLISDMAIDFEKWVILLNFRDNGLYFKTPIYLSKHYFTYYLSQQIELIFDVDDLFFYSTHKIFMRGNYLFVNDYGMQMNIMSRFGVRNHASLGKDYTFIDENPHNLRYENINIINPYLGVEKIIKNGKHYYKSKIHINGYLTIGYFKSNHKAAVAYNKAVDFLKRYVKNSKDYSKNFIEGIPQEEIDYYYVSIQLPQSLIKLADIK